MPYARTLGLLALLLSISWAAHPRSAEQTPEQNQPAPASSPTASPIPADSTALELVSAPPPDYPLEAAAKGLQGIAWIQLHISESGDVASTEILSGDPILANAAALAMKQWKFKPFIRDGRPVRVSRKMSYNFEIKGKGADPCAVVEAASAVNQAHQHIRLSQAVMEGALVHRVEPEYPMIARAKNVQGTVILEMNIGEDGRVADLKALCGPPELIPAALAAVRQWRYRPYIYEGKPVAVETTVKVRFHM